jgi:hypothetical protein
MEFHIPLRDPENYNFKSREEILELRRKYVNLTPQLVLGTYTPSEWFSAIEDGKPWWGLAGRSVWGRGEKSIEGPAEESRFLSNPLLLVGADPASAAIFKPSAIQPSDLQSADFPYAWKPTKLIYWPDKKLARVVYAVSVFNEQLFKWRDKLIKPIIYPAFSLVAYNARDFGLHYIFLDETKSMNVENYAKPKAEPVLIGQMIHCGGTCGYKGGCNNMSPQTLSIDRIKYTKLPARAYIKLWKDKPDSVTKPADMVFMVDLE